MTNVTEQCAHLGDGAIERYLADAMGPDERDRFEAHYLTCEHCQRELEFAAVVREAVAAESDDPSERERRHGRPQRQRRSLALAGTIAAAAAAAALAVFLVRPSVPPEFERLGAVDQPPIYLGVALRNDASPGDSIFGVAMRAYQAGDYRSAIAGLQDALDAGFDAPPVRFFLGASLLMRGEPGAAGDRFRAVIAAGDTPYLPEARFYLAKALLQQGRERAARAELETVADRVDDTGAAARDLLAALDEVRSGS